MKKILKIALINAIILIGGFGFGNPALAEQINDYQVQIRVNSDSSLDVREAIVYDFNDLQKHGIYRYIPIQYSRENFAYNLRVSNLSVKDENGQDYESNSYYSNNNLEIKIGNPDITITGVHTYVISYKIEKALNYFTDYDELYFNVNGFGWPVSISKIEAQVIFPQEIQPNENFDFKCFEGKYNQTNACDYATSNVANNISSVNFYSSNLNPEENLTILIKFPKQIVIAPTQEQVIKNIINDNWILILPILIFVILFIIWRRYGRGPQGRGIIIAEYDIPDNLTPIEIGTIIDDRTDNRDISAEIVYLAIKDI